MFKLRFALALLLSTGNGAFADTSGDLVGVSNQQPGAIQQWSSPPSAVPQSAYNSEDYEGEPYEDNRIRLMINPKKTITLNETNLRTWKVNPVTNSHWGAGVTEAFQVGPRSSLTFETGLSKQNETVSVNTSMTVFAIRNTSTGKHQPTPVNQSMINLTKEALTLAEPTILPNVGESPIIAEDSQTNTPREIPSEENPNPSNGVIIIENKTSSGDNSYVDIETDYNEDLANEEEESPSEVPDSNSYVIVLPEGKGQQTNFDKNISSIKPEIISDSLLYMLFNLTASSAMNQRNEKKILKELSEQKKQINDVDEKINNIYELLKKPN